MWDIMQQGRQLPELDPLPERGKHMKEKNSKAVNLPDMYTPQQVCDYLGISTNTLYAWIKAGKIKAVKIGRFWHISHDEVERIVKNGMEVKA